MDIEPQRGRMGQARPSAGGGDSKRLFAIIAGLSGLVVAVFFMMDRPSGGWDGSGSAFSSGSLTMPEKSRISKGFLGDFLKPRKSRDFNKASRTVETESAGEGRAAGSDEASAPDQASLSDNHAGVQTVQAGASPETSKLNAQPLSKTGSSPSASASLFTQGSAGSAGTSGAPSAAAAPLEARAAAAPPRAALPPPAATPAAQRSLGGGGPLKTAKGAPGPVSLPTASAQAAGQTTHTGAAPASPISGSPVTGTKSSAEGSGGGGSGSGGGGGGGDPAGQPAVEYCGNSQASESALSGQRSAIKEEARILEVNAGKPGMDVPLEMARPAGRDLRDTAAALGNLSQALESDAAFFRTNMPSEASELADMNGSVIGTRNSALQSSDNLAKAANSFLSLKGKTPIPENPTESVLTHSWAQTGFIGYGSVHSSLSMIKNRHQQRSGVFIKTLEAMAGNPTKASFAADGIVRLERQRVLVKQASSHLRDSTWEYLTSQGRATAAGLPETIAARRARVIAIRDNLLSMNMPNAESTPIRNKLTSAVNLLTEAEFHWKNTKTSSEDQRAGEATSGSDKTIAAQWEMSDTAADIQRAEDKKRACTPPPPPAPPPSGK